MGLIFRYQEGKQRLKLTAYGNVILHVYAFMNENSSYICICIMLPLACKFCLNPLDVGEIIADNPSHLLHLKQNHKTFTTLANNYRHRRACCKPTSVCRNYMYNVCGNRLRRLCLWMIIMKITLVLSSSRGSFYEGEKGRSLKSY